jgi:hypothetical protein
MSSASLSPSILFWPTLSKILGFPSPPQTRSTFGSSADTAGEHWALSRTVNWTLAMSLTIVVLRWVRERVAEQKALRDDDEDVDHQHDWQLHTVLYADLRRHLRVWYSQCRWFVQRAATAAHNCFPGRKHQRTIEPDWTLVTHTGSCQCRAVRFQVRALSTFVVFLEPSALLLCCFVEEENAVRSIIYRVQAALQNRLLDGSL